MTIHTVEHVLAAVFAPGLDDLVVELDGPEPPILDGSFLPWLDLLAEAGMVEQEEPPTWIDVPRAFSLIEGDAATSSRRPSSSGSPRRSSGTIP